MILKIPKEIGSDQFDKLGNDLHDQADNFSNTSVRAENFSSNQNNVFGSSDPGQQIEVAGIVPSCSPNVGYNQSNNSRTSVSNMVQGYFGPFLNGVKDEHQSNDGNVVVRSSTATHSYGQHAVSNISNGNILDKFSVVAGSSKQHRMVAHEGINDVIVGLNEGQGVGVLIMFMKGYYFTHGLIQSSWFEWKPGIIGKDSSDMAQKSLLPRAANSHKIVMVNIFKEMDHVWLLVGSNVTIWILIGNKRSLFYKAYALYYEKMKKFNEAEKMYHLGVQNLAGPADELQKSFDQFFLRLEKHKNKEALCGITIGAIEVCVGSSGDLAMIHMQAGVTLPAAQGHSCTNTFNVLCRIVADEGVWALWKGAGLDGCCLKRKARGYIWHKWKEKKTTLLLIVIIRASTVE
ncbi:putative mitotic spindle checkpoint protein Bub1/Mad3 [Helianthus annuus]|nr:putative mitotic spindle checkpoint protein Bub1/Mad3 [Helianthus annuus]